MTISNIIEIQSENIVYVGEQNVKELEIKNKSQFPILYKVKAHIKSQIWASPNFGWILPNAVNKIKVQRNKQTENNTKLKIYYAECREESLDDKSFKELWTKYEKDKHKKKLMIQVINQESYNKLQQLKASNRNMKQSQDQEEVKTSQLSSSPQFLLNINESQKQNPSVRQFSTISLPSIISIKIDEYQNQRKGWSIFNIFKKEKPATELQQQQQSQSDNKQKQNKSFLCVLCLILTALIFLGFGYYVGVENVDCESWFQI